MQKESNKKNEMKTYHVALDKELFAELKQAKLEGLNLQPLVREFIANCIKKNKNNYENIIKQ